MYYARLPVNIYDVCRCNWFKFQRSADVVCRDYNKQWLFNSIVFNERFRRRHDNSSVDNERNRLVTFAKTSSYSRHLTQLQLLLQTTHTHTHTHVTVVIAQQRMPISFTTCTRRDRDGPCFTTRINLSGGCCQRHHTTGDDFNRNHRFVASRRHCITFVPCSDSKLPRAKPTRLYICDRDTDYHNSTISKASYAVQIRENKFFSTDT